MKTSEMIERTIDRIQDKGWARGGKVRNPNAPMCIVNSFDATNPIRDGFPINLFHMVEMNCGVISWNDRLAADRHEVVATLLTMYNLAIIAGD